MEHFRTPQILSICAPKNVPCGFVCVLAFLYHQNFNSSACCFCRGFSRAPQMSGAAKPLCVYEAGMTRLIKITPRVHTSAEATSRERYHSRGMAGMTGTPSSVRTMYPTYYSISAKIIDRHFGPVTAAQKQPNEGLSCQVTCCTTYTNSDGQGLHSLAWTTLLSKHSPCPT